MGPWVTIAGRLGVIALRCFACGFVTLWGEHMQAALKTAWLLFCPFLCNLSALNKALGALLFPTQDQGAF